MKKQVIFIIHTLNIGGAERQIVGLANYLSKKGFEIKIVLLDNSIIKYHLNPNIRVTCINNNELFVPQENVSNCELFHTKKTHHYKKIKRKIILKILSLVNSEKYYTKDYEIYLKNKYVDNLLDYLFQYPDALLISRMLVPNIVSLMAKEKLRNQLIFCDSSSPTYGLEEDHSLLQLRNKYLKNAEQGVFQTIFQLDYYSAYSKFKKIVIPNYLPVQTLPERFTGIRTKRIVTFCRIVPVKNIRLLIDAFVLFNHFFPEYQLEIYGEGGEKESLINYIHTEKINNVHMFPESESIHDLVVDAKMFVSSSDREGLSNSMLESMAIGLPVICTDCEGGGARMMIKDGTNGLLVPVNNKERLAKAMCRVAEDDIFANNLSENALNIREELDIENIGKKWIELLINI